MIELSTRIKRAIEAFRAPVRGREYGHDKTIHRTGCVNVELTEAGEVVAVWFRCSTLPFTQHVVDHYRARDMREMGDRHPPRRMIAVEFSE